jgi:D-serine deaminase-like pyridoxal phosphate-dependent protein
VFPGSPLFDELLSTLFASPFISVYGFYSHAGHSYVSKSLSEASVFLSAEVGALNDAAAAGLAALANAFKKEVHEQPFVLSAGSTPTAHAVSEEARTLLSNVLNGKLELHAGASGVEWVDLLHLIKISRKLPVAGSTTAEHRPN